MRLRVTLVAEPDGDRVHAHCAELTGLREDGDTEKDGFRRARQAVKTHLQAMDRFDIPLPSSVMEASLGRHLLPPDLDFARDPLYR